MAKGRKPLSDDQKRLRGTDQPCRLSGPASSCCLSSGSRRRRCWRRSARRTSTTTCRMRAWNAILSGRATARGLRRAKNSRSWCFPSASSTSAIRSCAGCLHRPSCYVSSGLKSSQTRSLIKILWNTAVKSFLNGLLQRQNLTLEFWWRICNSLQIQRLSLSF